MSRRDRVCMGLRTGLALVSAACDYGDKVAGVSALHRQMARHYRVQRHVIVIRTVSHAYFHGCRHCGGSLASQYGGLRLPSYLRPDSPRGFASSGRAPQGGRESGASPSSASVATGQVELLGQGVRVLVKQTTAVDPRRLGDLAGRLDPEGLMEVNVALRAVLDLK